MFTLPQLEGAGTVILVMLTPPHEFIQVLGSPTSLQGLLGITPSTSIIAICTSLIGVISTSQLLHIVAPILTVVPALTTMPPSGQGIHTKVHI